MTAKMGLFALFARLADPPQPRTGAWRIRTEDGHDGVVLMEGGRICWANHDLVGRLSDEIERRYGVSRTTIEQIIRACRENRQPFGATLVEQGLLTQPQLTSVLRDHTCRSILSLVRSGVRDCEWIAHQGGGYAPETTFTVTQAAARCVTLSKGLSGDDLEQALEAMLAGEATGLLIHVGLRLPFAASAMPVSWKELRRLLTWALRIDEQSPLPSRSYLAGRGHNSGWAMWRVGSIIGVAVTTSDDVQRRLLLRVASTLGSWAVEHVP